MTGVPLPQTILFPVTPSTTLVLEHDAHAQAATPHDRRAAWGRLHRLAGLLEDKLLIYRCSERATEAESLSCPEMPAAGLSLTNDELRGLFGAGFDGNLGSMAQLLGRMAPIVQAASEGAWGFSISYATLSVVDKRMTSVTLTTPYGDMTLPLGRNGGLLRGVSYRVLQKIIAAGLQGVPDDALGDYTTESSIASTLSQTSRLMREQGFALARCNNRTYLVRPHHPQGAADYALLRTRMKGNGGRHKVFAPAT